MTRARAQDDTPDLDAAEVLTIKARLHVEDAHRRANHPSSRFLLAYQAALDLMNATLRAAGRKIGHGTSGHIARITECQRLMPDQESLLDSIDLARQQRNKVTYDGVVSDADIVDDLISSVEDLADLVESFIRDARAASDAEDERR